MAAFKAAQWDDLTGLPGRAAFEAAFEEALQTASKQGVSISVMVVDIDLFGRLNEEFGTGVGDRVVVLLAERLRREFSASDSVFRYGGDAMGLLLPEVEKEQAFLLAEHFREGFAGKHVVAPEETALELQVQVSVGVASYPDDGKKALGILDKASEALYRAKVSGRNRVCLAREEKMVTKTSHYTQGQLLGLRRLAERKGLGEAILLREALNDLLRKHNA